MSTRETTPTPAPWIITRNAIDHTIRAEWGGAIARVYSFGRTSHSERDANARLIAAAPELLGALAAIADAASCEQVDGFSRAAHIEMLARKAIEAASGQTDANSAEPR
jgi:hypothetical protein